MILIITYTRFTMNMSLILVKSRVCLCMCLGLGIIKWIGNETIAYLPNSRSMICVQNSIDFSMTNITTTGQLEVSAEARVLEGMILLWWWSTISISCAKNLLCTVHQLINKKMCIFIYNNYMSLCNRACITWSSKIYSHDCFCVWKVFLKKFNFFYFFIWN
jgi:hypothetical protein